MIDGKKVSVVIVAAGRGTRMQGDEPKQFMKLAGVPMFIQTVRVFAKADLVDEIVLVTGREQMETCRELLAQHPCEKIKAIACGGSRRQDSSAAGFAVCTGEIVMIHDGARPFVDEQIIQRVAAAASKKGAAVCAVPVKDTIRTREKTLRRDELYAVQTPQGFDYQLLESAFRKAGEDGFAGTDDASLVEHIGCPVEIVEGSYDNIKITTREDLEMEYRSGTGFDVHRLVPGRKLILGGVEIPGDMGLLGHSDADVLTHAVMDALLGAAGAGDIGMHFPDDNPAYEGADSMVLLEQTAARLKEAGYTIVNIDVTLIAQRPKVAPYKEAMRERLAAAAGLERDRVNVSATTTEGCGFTGRGEGMAAQAVCSLARRA
ncbi:MAG: 2-C-methyl-D-erythritol 4-phosphate cytidylyltransferase [Eubacteriales bacterium]|nr:2-C-methyl-D-erythritol 4-phosphate cytidylyltransferase [Eubacteriales bacterium]